MSTSVRAGPQLPSLYLSKPWKANRRPQQVCLPNGLAGRQYGGVVLKQLKPVSSKNYQQGSVVCLFGGKDKSERNKESFPWSFEKVMEIFKGKSVEDVLRQQIEKEEYYDGGSGNNPPRGGGGGGRDGFGEPEDEGLAGVMDETLQVFLATIGFIFLYFYIINGQDLIRLWRDFIVYLVKGTQTARLKKSMNKWKRWYKKYTEPELIDKFWLEKLIVNTPTAYNSPQEYRLIIKTLEEKVRE